MSAWAEIARLQALVMQKMVQLEREKLINFKLNRLLTWQVNNISQKNSPVFSFFFFFFQKDGVFMLNLQADEIIGRMGRNREAACISSFYHPELLASSSAEAPPRRSSKGHDLLTHLH